MPQSLASIPVHLAFSTKNRVPALLDSARVDLHRYTSAILKGLGCRAMLVNSVEDHIHILFELGRTIAVSEVVEQVKTSTSKWIKKQGSEFGDFHWQGGYGAFGVSASDVPRISGYIRDQREHHRVKSFQEEFRDLLDSHGIAFDERYVWD